MMGSSGDIDWRQNWLTPASIPVLLRTYRQSRSMNMLILGKISAWQLGLPLWSWRNALAAAIGWMVGVSVVLADVIGLIGLVIPYILRLRGLTGHRVLLPGCTLVGANTLPLVDTVACLALAVVEPSIGMVTVALGAPVFIWLLLKVGRQL